MIDYLKRLLDAEDSASIKRFTVLTGLSLFILNNLFPLLSRMPLANASLISENNLYCFYIIGLGVLGISIDVVGAALVEKAKAKAAAEILGPPVEPMPEQPLTMSAQSSEIDKLKVELLRSLLPKTKRNGTKRDTEITE